ncbi:MFS transporter [Streptomyces adustus]|uniref:MFS transporter n=1 Tax=Streptomyces adustus TaxID=1609272 RepID=A0A5N8VAD0_9ACTN|nr:MFS transporter [Streptomyces adustus]MPY31602.1 MFS transporter [Streptomyces adustus]
MTTTARRASTAAGQRTDGGPARASLILAIICISYFMVILDNSIVFTGLPQIRSDMGFSETGLSWITNAYVLVFGGLLLLGARAGDLCGHRRMFLSSLVVFSLTSLLVGAAQSQWWLIGARALQGVGAAVLAPSALSLLTRSFAEGRARDRAMAAYSAVAGLGAALGLVVGGLVADLVSWRAGFFLNVPIGVVMMVMAVRFLPETERRRGRFDIAGALLATVGSTALVLGIVDAADLGWTAPLTLTPLSAGVVMLGLFVRVERRAAQPIVPLRLFAGRERSGAYLTRMLYMGAMMGFFFFTAQFVQSVYHWTPLQAGLAFLPMTLVNFVVAVQVPKLLERFARPRVLLAGVVLTTLGMVWLSRLDLHTPYPTGVALPMVLIGAGQGLALAPLTSSGVDGVAPADAGAGAGLVNTVHQIGSALSLSILTAVAAAVSTDDAAADIAARSGAALTGSATLLALAVVAVLTLIVPMRAPRNARSRYRRPAL